MKLDVVRFLCALFLFIIAWANKDSMVVTSSVGLAGTATLSVAGAIQKRSPMSGSFVSNARKVRRTQSVVTARTNSITKFLELLMGPIMNADFTQRKLMSTCISESNPFVLITQPLLSNNSCLNDIFTIVNCLALMFDQF